MEVDEPIALAGEEGCRLEMGFAQRTRQTNPLGDADGCSRVVEGCVDSFPIQLEDPVADAALEDEPEADQKEAATCASVESEGE